MKPLLRSAFGLMSLLLFTLSPGVRAAQPINDKPFADTKIVLQISDPNPFKQTLVLNVAGNILKHYGQDRVDLEVVAFGPGLRLLFANNANKARIAALASSGVRFSACSNTIRNMTAKLGYEPKLNPVAQRVSAGVVRIVDLVHDGYTLVKP